MHRKKTKKTSSPKNLSHAPATRIQRWGLPLFWAGVLILGLWVLMTYSTPQSNLEPYDNIKKSASTPDPAEDSESSTDESNILEEHSQNSPDLIKQASTVGTPPAQLPRETLKHISQGMKLTEEGKYNQGDIEFEKAAELSPNSADVFAIWGAALRMQKKFKGANRKFARAHELAPDDVEIIFNWAVSTMEERNSDEAIRLFQKSLKIEPRNALAYNYLGKSYGQKKLYEKEAESYRQAIKLDPEFAAPHFNLGIVLGIMKKFEEAAPHFERAIELDKSFEKPFVVQMLTAMGRYKSSSKEKPKESSPKPSEPVHEAKVSPPSEPGKEHTHKDHSHPEEKKSEGSDHKMEGSKNVNETTNINGQVLVNGKPLSQTGVVFLETKNKLRVPNQKTKPLTIRQSNLQFIPKHSVVPVGSKITFSNEDREVHNIFSKSRNHQFNLGAMAAGSSRTLTFDKAGPVVLRCNLHKEMIGTVFVVPNGYYTQPDENGKYSFDKVKSQGYLFQYWHPNLIPEEVEANMKSLDLKGVDEVIDLNIKSASKPGEIHDLVDPTDYKAIVDNIEKEVFQAIEDWKAGKRSIPRKRMLMAITKHYDGEGLKGALAKSFSVRRSILLEKKLDEIRKAISGIGVSKNEVTEESLKSKAKIVISQLRVNVQELEARLNPDFEKNSPKK